MNPFQHEIYACSRGSVAGFKKTRFLKPNLLVLLGFLRVFFLNFNVQCEKTWLKSEN